jgi:hypothetical protein
MPPRASSRTAAASTPPRDSAGAGCDRSSEHSPAWPGLLQDGPGGQEGSAQQVSSTQLFDTQSAGSSQAPAFGTRVWVGVTVGVLLMVGVCVIVGVLVGVRVGVEDGVAVGVLVGVAVGVLVGVWV